VRLVLAGVSPVISANESLAYRYFHSMRLLQDRDGDVFLPQGHTPGLLYHGINLGLSFVVRLPEQDLRRRVDTFAHSIALLLWLSVSAIILLCLHSRKLGLSDGLLVAIVPLAQVYGSMSGLRAWVAPDYYQAEIVLGALALMLFLRHIRGGVSDTPRRSAVFLGALMGAMAATKVTLMLTGALVLWPTLVAKESRVREALFRLALAAGGAVFAFGFIIMAYYLFDIASVRKWFGSAYDFTRAPGNIEPDFWAMLLSRKYSYIVPIAGAWLGSLVWCWIAGLREHRRTDCGLWIGWSLLLTSMHVAGLLQRPAGTTLFELGMFLTASCATMVAWSSGNPRPGRRSILGALALGGYSVAFGIPNALTLPSTRELRQWSDSSWEVHSWLSASNRPVVVFLPDNRYCAGTVEEALMKGMSDCPTWDISRGDDMLKRVAPHLLFRHAPFRLEDDSVLLWTEAPGVPSILEQNPHLQRAVEGKIRRWQFPDHVVCASRVGSLAQLRRPFGSNPHSDLSCVVLREGASGDEVGTGPEVVPNGHPDSVADLTLVPGRQPWVIRSVHIYSSDPSGNPAGGGYWDTQAESRRPIALISGDKVLNRGRKRPLGIRVDGESRYELHLDDGGMMKTWNHFMVVVFLEDGSYLETLLTTTNR